MRVILTRRDALTALSTLAAFSIPAVRAAAAPAPSLAALARDVDRAESVRAVKRLQHAWALYVDLGKWDEAAALFTDDAELAHADDHFKTRPDIRAYFQRMIGKGTVGLPARTIHTPFLMAPIIILSDDGNRAKGRWHAFSMRGAFGGDASWQGGIFRCEYVRTGGAWKIDRQIFTPLLLGPYEGGWKPFKPELPMVPYDFEPGEVGKPFPLGDAVPAAASSASLASLAGRIEALRDETAVRNLQNALGYYTDWKMWDDAVDLFEPTGGVAVEGQGSWLRAKGVRRWLERLGPAGLREGEVNDRIQFDTVVEIAADGRHARARGIELGMLGEDNARAWWTLARFDNLFVKRGGTWRIAQVRLQPWLRTDYDTGWAKDWQDEPKATPDDKSRVDFPPIWQIERQAPAVPPLARVPLAEARLRLHAAAGTDSAENLTGGYGQFLDDNHWEELGSIFSREGERDSAGGGFIRTPARIASYSRKRYGPYNEHRGFANMHMLTQPVTHVSDDGQKAQIRVRLFQTVIAPPPAEGAPPGRGAMIVTGIYEDDIVFEDGAWKIRRADIDHFLYAPYATGWKQIPDGYSKRMSPPLTAVADEPFDAFNTGDIDAVFPKVPHNWFHYTNPVSGRVPPYLMPKYILPQP